MFGIPQSTDTLDYLGKLFDQEGWQPILKTKLNLVKLSKELTEEKKKSLTREILREKHTEKSMVGLFDQFDKTVLERFCGSSMVT